MMEGGDQSVVRPKAKPFAEAVPSAADKLRARKQQVMRDAMSEAAAKLFRERGFETVTVEEIAQAAGVSRRTFFRYFESKEDVVVTRFERDTEELLTELAARPACETPLLAIRNALVPAIRSALREADLLRDVIRLLRETSTLRRALMEHRNRYEERVAALMIRRLECGSEDNRPILLAFLTRALHEAVLNAWYDHETDDIEGLVDELITGLCSITAEMPVSYQPSAS
jgi:AcrR family transcriptional regulator